MENWQTVPNGFDMLNDSGPLKSREAKIPSPIASADRLANEDEEVAARSDSSSGGSSLSDLRKRLQHLPSPHIAARLANQVAHVSRRLSQKRHFYFRGAPNPIEENVEIEEQEEQESLFFERSFGELRSKDARTRRRAKIRLENARNQAMVVTNPAEANASNLNTGTNENPNFDSNLFAEKGESFKNNSEGQSSLEMALLNNSQSVTQQYTLSARLPGSHSPYRNPRDDSISNSPRHQRKAPLLHHLYTSVSNENSPKDRSELRPLSPASSKSARRTKFGGYRPQTDIVVQNLSSDSEAESSNEIATSGRAVPCRTTDNLAPAAARKTFGMDDSLPSLSLSSRASNTNRIAGNSARQDALENFILSSASKMNIHGGRYRKTLLESLRKLPFDNYSYKTANTSRSECCRSDRGNVEEPMFFSAREDSYDREHFDISSSALGSAAGSNVPTETEVNDQLRESRGNHGLNTSGPSTERNCGQNLQNANETFTPETSSLRSPRNTLRSPVFESPAGSNRMELRLENANDAITLKQAISKCILSLDNSNDVESPQSENVLSPQLRTCRSATQSGPSTSREFYVGEFTRMLEGDLPSPNSNRDEEPRDKDVSGTGNDQESTNVPTLALTSQEVSYSASPADKTCTGRRLDADFLIEALSNATLRQEAAEEAQTRRSTRDESYSDGKTVSRPGTSENNLSLEKGSDTRSLKPVENQSVQATDRASCRSSLSMRSKIPVKIPSSDRSKVSVANKHHESEGQTSTRRTSPVESSRRTYRRNSLSPGSPNSTFGSRRSSQVRRSCETSPSLKREADALSDSTANSREQCQRSSSRCSRRESESLGVFKSVQSRICLTGQTDRSSNDKSEAEARDQSPIRAVSSKGTNCDASLVNRPMTAGTYRPPKFSENWQKQAIAKGKGSSSDGSSSENEFDDFVKSLPSSARQESAKKPEEPRMVSADTRFGGYQNKYFNTTYEGEVYEKVAETRKSTIMENQIGDGECQEILMEDSEREKFEGASFDSSPDDEDYTKGKRMAENRDKLRFSLEKMAAEQFRRNLNTEQTKTIQSDTTAFFAEKFYEIPQFPLTCSSSTSKLRHDKSRDSPRFKKKSQDRFPFTISEKTSVASMKFKVPGRLSNLDEDEEDRGYRLDTHPSITRLAGSGFEDSPADIISYVSQTEQGDRRVKPSGMKSLVKKFSARWKKSKRRDSGVEADAKLTNILYKNRDYREDCESSIESCSESSLLNELKMYESLGEKLNKNGRDSPNEKSSIVSEGRSFKKENSENASVIGTENPCRRYDKDDLWVQAFKNLDSDYEESKDVAETSNKMDESASKRDPYSVFFVKSAQKTPETSARTLLSQSNEEKNVSTEKRKKKKKKNRVKFRASSLVVTQKCSDENLNKRRSRNMQSGCLCLRFYRMIVPISFGSMSKYRSRINDDLSPAKKKSRRSSQKKKG